MSKVGIEDYNFLRFKHKLNGPVCHTVYIKEHSIRTKDPNKPVDRTIFILNIPPYIGEKELRYCLEKFGKVESIFFVEKPWNKCITTTKDIFSNDLMFKFKIAYVVFKTTSSLKSVLMASELCCYDETGVSIIKSGIEKWEEKYYNDIIDEDNLLNEANEYLEIYDQKEKSIEEKKNEIDENGWMTVRKHGKKLGFGQTEAKSMNDEEMVGKRSKKSKELKNFYTFQIKESKMQNILKLQQKFKEDNEKLEILKKARRYKPF